MAAEVEEELKIETDEDEEFKVEAEVPEQQVREETLV